MAFSVFDSQGTPLDRQHTTWRDMVRKPISKLDDDAFTRMRVILMTGIEREAVRFSHMAARCNMALRQPLAEVRRVEQHQAALVGGLPSPDHSPLETTIAHEQLAIELTASVAKAEPDSYLHQVYRFGLLEEVDHLYRYAALLDRMEGKDANNILQSYTDILPGRPTLEHHRAPRDDLRIPYDRSMAAMLSKLHALTVTAAEAHTHDYYMTVGPTFADPVARQLYAEIASVEEQHVTQYESLLDPTETWVEQWLLHEANECYTYYSCVETETNHHVKAVWERCLDYELGHFHLAAEAFRRYERRDPAEIVGDFPRPIELRSQRDYVRSVLASEVDLRALGTQFVPREHEDQASIDVRRQLNRDGAPSAVVAASYVWTPGTELVSHGTAGTTALATTLPANRGGVVMP